MNPILQLEIDCDKPVVEEKCICTTECDCQNPPPDDWDGKSGVWHVSNECPIHNDYPMPDPDCPAKIHRE